VTTAFRALSRQPRHSRGALARVLAGLWLVLHVFVVAAAPVADGLVDHGDAVVVHMEDADGGQCPASHGPEACDLCQLAQGMRGLAGQAKALTVPAVARASALPVSRVTHPVAFEFLEGHSSRAPPALG